MLFTSIDFFLFLPLVITIYFLSPVRYRWVWLLVASYFFYMYWNPWYIGLIVGSSLVDYIAGLKIFGTKQKASKNFWLGCSVVANLSILFTFKYFNFFSSQYAAVVHQSDPGYEALILNVLLPVGISFYTFQSMSYTIDVYRGQIKAESHLGRFLLYVSFFPQLVAGPIERARDLLPQFHFDYHFDYHRIVAGLQLILWGLFKKLVIADKLAHFVNEVYSQPGAYEGLTVWVASVLFLFQLFCDFSAYTDIAIGTAKIFGIKLSKNFDNRVYWITSFTKFWRGWHITLTNWFRDYVYFPLVSLGSSLFWITATAMITAILIGVWHGAEWTFFIWGALNGVAVVLEVTYSKKISAFFSWVKIRRDSALRWWINLAFCFNAGVLSVIFFRANNITDAFQLCTNIFKIKTEQLSEVLFQVVAFHDFLLMLALLAAMDFFHKLMGDDTLNEFLTKQTSAVRWLFYLVILHAIFYLGEPPTTEFIYFEF